MLGLALNASAAMTITLDENGNSSGLTGITSGLAVDAYSSGPNPTGTGMTTLDYVLPKPAGIQYGLGWVQINDPSGAISDLVHFTILAYGGPINVFVYSADAGTDLADHWPTTMPPASLPSPLGWLTVTEDASGVATWTGDNTHWGPYYTGTDLVPYTFELQSSATPVVPEASTMIAGMLLLLPFGASTFRILRRRAA